MKDRKQSDQQIQEVARCSTSGELLYTAIMFDCHPISSSEPTFKRGDPVYIKNKGEGGTRKTSLKVEGTIPKSHVPPLEDEE